MGKEVIETQDLRRKLEKRRLQINLGKHKNIWVDLKQGYLSVHCGATMCLQKSDLKCDNCICANKEGLGAYTHSLENLRKLKRVRDLNESLTKLNKKE